MTFRILLLTLICCLLSIGGIGAATDMVSHLKLNLERLESSPDDKIAISNVAKAYLLLGDYDNAGIYADRLLRIAEETSDRSFAGLQGAIIKASFLMVRGDGENAFRMLEYARVIAQGNSDHAALANIHNGFVLYYATLAKDDYAAISHCFEGLEQAELAGDDYRAVMLLANLAELLNDRYDTEGLGYALRSYELAEKNNDNISLFYSALTLADAYLIQDRLSEAGEALRVAEECASRLGYERYAELVLVQAIYKYRSGDIKEAVKLCEHTLNCEFNDPSRSVIMRAYLTYAKILNEIGQPAKAVEIVNESLAYAEGFHLSSYVGDLMKEMAEANRQLGKYSAALEYSTRYSAFMDSTYRLSRERAMMEDRIKYEVDEQDRRIHEKEVQLRTSRLRVWILAGLLAITICFIMVVLAQYRRKKRLYRAIVVQNNEYLAREQLLLDRIEKTQSDRQPGSKPLLSVEKADDILSRFLMLMTEEKLFKNPDLTVSAVADRLGSNRTYVSRAINESGKTFNQIVNDYRIREAIAMISDLDAAFPLKHISSEVGFSSISTFYSTFQAVTGMTPARYRAQLKEIKE